MGQDCPFELPHFADLPQMRELLTAWDSWRGGEIVPLRSQVKLFHINHFLSRAMLFDMEAPDTEQASGLINCRYVGSVFHEIYGQDFTGQNYLDMTATEDRSTRSKRLFAAANQPCIAVWGVAADEAPGGLPSAVGASMPIMPDDLERATQLLHVVVSLGDVTFSDFANREKYEKVQLSDRFSLVDIGKGVPDHL